MGGAGRLRAVSKRFVSREVSRGYPCPSCGAGPAEPCMGRSGPRLPSHQGRVDVALAAKQRKPQRGTDAVLDEPPPAVPPAVKAEGMSAAIDAARSPSGGWSKAQLAAWGVTWPPPKGWRRRLIEAATPKDADRCDHEGAHRVTPGGMCCVACGGQVPYPPS